ncbi:Piwi-domain-containing protein [Cylindrobasidium torrendii FP15055 ss-10]|uniref:Piwi-domain-containing protein n=1 Tax=Cylindrobasidium torrendii FP15055 ss-10 TaxID=1314674 RepID=A0A0D7BH23_9AGAR|nr:Piwi-domain-containing protein [Cylindrobasidium torrendii FP15055 ss-10]
MSNDPNARVLAGYRALIQRRRNTVATVNAFELTWNPTGKIYHYDVIITPAASWTPRKPNQPITIGRRKAMELIYRLQTMVDPATFAARGVYDGKSIFSPRPFGTQSSYTYDMPFDATRPEHFKKVTVVVTLVNTINFDDLNRAKAAWMHRGSKPTTEDIRRTTAIINMLTLAVQGASRESSNVLAKGTSYFMTPPPGREIYSRIRVFQLWPGFSQAVRLTRSPTGLILNVDTAIGVVVAGGPAEDFCLGYLRSSYRDVRDQRALFNMTKGDPKFRDLDNIFRGLKVRCEVGRNKRTMNVSGLVPAVGDVSFDDKSGRTWAVHEYFRHTYNRTVQRNELGIKTKSGAVIPMSCLFVEKQLFKGQVPSTVIQDILGKDGVPRNPRDKFQKIQDGWSTMGLGSSEFLSNAGVAVNPRALDAAGVLLTRPDIRFNQPRETNSGHAGRWDVMGKTLMTPAKEILMSVVDFSRAKNPNQVAAFANTLCKVMNQRGITFVAQPQFHFGENPHGNVANVLLEKYRALKNLVNSPKPRLLVAILPDNAPSLYNTVKQTGDVQLGGATQCVRWSSKQETSNERSLDQYLNNLILKINPKLGGQNFSPMDPSMEFFRRGNSPSMIFGADVSHPGPGSMYPSMASVVASLDPWAARYTGRLRVQPRRVEVIEELGAMVTECFTDYYAFNRKMLPRVIFFYRDGVSEGEMSQVKAEEFDRQFMGAVNTFYGQHNVPYRPEVTFVVVTKRHHIRFSPGQGPADKTGNCQAGFVVDADTLAAPEFDDFFLQSQVGLKGTSVPGHYTILHDDIFKNFFQGNTAEAKKAIQHFTYMLCHTYARSTSSVKIPAPVYYADLLCSRVKFYFPDLDQMSINSNHENIDWWKRNFMPPNPFAVQNGMYWM